MLSRLRVLLGLIVFALAVSLAPAEAARKLDPSQIDGTLTPAQMPGLTGDVVSPQGSVTTTLAPGVAARNYGVVKHLRDYPGADPTGAQPSDAALRAFLADCKSVREICNVGPGNFSFSSQTLFDTAPIYSQGVKLRGDGCLNTQFNYTGSASPAFRLGTDTLIYSDWISFTVNPSPGQTLSIGGFTATFVASGATGNQVNIGSDLATTLARLQALLSTSNDPSLTQFYFTSFDDTQYLNAYTPNVGANVAVASTVTGATVAHPTTTGRGDSFYSMLDQIGFGGAIANGPVLQIARDDTIDALNSPVINVCINNNSPATTAEGIRFNSIYDAEYIYVVSNTNGNGIACKVRGWSFGTLSGSCSNGSIGVDVTSTPAQYTYALHVRDMDMEVITGRPVVIDASGGHTPSDIRFESGTYVYNGPCAIDVQAGYDIKFDGGNLLGSPADFCNSVNAVEERNGKLISGSQVLGWVLTNAAGSMGLQIDADGNGHLSEYTPGGGLAFGVTATGNYSFFIGATSVLSLTSGGMTSTVPFNAPSYYTTGAAGTSCSGAPTSNFKSVNGLVTQC